MAAVPPRVAPSPGPGPAPVSMPTNPPCVANRRELALADGHSGRCSRRAWLRRGLVAAGIGLPLAALFLLWDPSGPLGRALGLPRGPDDPGSALRARYAASELLDRYGSPLQLATASHRQLGLETELAAVSPRLIATTLAAEDQRFYDHPGIDPIAVVRAAAGNLRAGRVTSGASTLTQQLARMLNPQPRGWRSKLREALLARQLERHHDKETLLGWYLAFAPYGGLLRGAEAAARTCYGRSASELSWMQAALLAVVPRSPTALDLRRGLPKARRHAVRLLERMHREGQLDAAALRSALDEEVRVVSQPTPFEAPHLLPMLAPELGAKPRQLHTTLDGPLQAELQGLLRQHVSRLAGQNAHNAALVVVNAATGEVLALVGSQGWRDIAHLGANNGALALRQPGSTLKPFLYGLYFAEGGSTADVLLDVRSSFSTEQGLWTPDNYGERFHGPIRARLALANSLNVPAVRLAATLGVDRLQQTLQRAGIDSLGRASSHYGLGLALGDAEVSLLQLTGAATTFARGGTAVRPRLLGAVVDGAGVRREVAGSPPESVLTPEAAAIVSAVLRDPVARAASFGRDSALDVAALAGGPPAVSVKTGTSKGYRDALAIGWTADHVIGVWVGNFDGRPMREATGAVAAAPLLRDAFLLLQRRQQMRPAPTPATVQAIEVCPLSGLAKGPHCPHAVEELALASAPRRPPCSWHQQLALDSRNGLRATAACPAALVRTEPRVVYPPALHGWARDAGMALAPMATSPLCGPEAAGVERAGGLQILEPTDGARFWLDGALSGKDQAIALVATSAESGRRLRWTVDGQPLGRVHSGRRLLWQPSVGRHRLRVSDAAEEATSSALAMAHVDDRAASGVAKIGRAQSAEIEVEVLAGGLANERR